VCVCSSGDCWDAVVCVCVCVCIDGDEGIKSGGVKGAVLPRFILCNMSFGRG
jgi:hypothetical protein